MTQDEIIWQNEVLEMAEQSGLFAFSAGESLKFKAFAKLVEERTAAKEREACAKLVDDIEWKCITDDVDDPSLKEVVKAIRARGKA
jgi:hypothetical protein